MCGRGGHGAGELNFENESKLELKFAKLLSENRLTIIAGGEKGAE